MQEPESALIVDPSGLSFRAWLKPVGEDENDAQVMLQLEDGTQFIVPRSLLTPEGEGRYTLGVNLREVAREAAAQNTPQRAAQNTAYAVESADATAISLAEETLQVGKRRVETGRVRLRKTVAERTETVDVPLMREQVEVERVSVGRPVAEAEPVRHEGDTLVIPRYEEVLVVSKQLVLVEEVRIRTTRAERREPQQVTLRREELEAERLEDPADLTDTNTAP